MGTNLSQSEISALESGGFVLDDRIPLDNSTPATVFDIPNSKDAVGSTSARLEDLGNVAFVPSDPLKFNLGHPRSSMMSLRNQLEASLDGDKRPTIRDGRPIRFVSRSSPDHLKKMESSRSISCSIMKFVKVPSPSYGIVLTLCTPGSVERKELYEVSISNYPSCSCPDFKFMKARANRKRKWMPCKHLYFVLLEHFSCTKEDVFIHSPGWTPNEVKLLVGELVQVALIFYIFMFYSIFFASLFKWIDVLTL